MLCNVHVLMYNVLKYTAVMYNAIAIICSAREYIKVKYTAVRNFQTFSMKIYEINLE